MDYKKITASTNTETRDIWELSKPTGNIYEMV
ncbi:MAG: RNA polymerase Rpb6, partial [Dysgonamonadaceae bacterium]